MQDSVGIQYRIAASGRPSRPGRPTIRTTYQLLADGVPEGNGEPGELLGKSIHAALEWLGQKYDSPLPPEASLGRSFECEIPGQTLECVAIPEEGVWSARLVQPDAPFAGRRAVPGRTWTSEIAFRLAEGTVKCGVRVICASLPYATDDVELTRPRIVSTLSVVSRLQDIRPIDGRAWQVTSDEDLQFLKSFLANPSRRLPVYLLTEADERELGLRVRRFLLDEMYLAPKLQGLGHVVTMRSDATYRWTDLVGKHWSAFRGAVRTYRPGLQFGDDPFSAHPLALASQVLACAYEDRKAEDAFAKLLIDRAHRDAASSRMDWGKCVFYVDARRLEAERALTGARDRADWKAIYELEISSLKEKIKEMEKESEEWSDQAIEAGKLRDSYAEENKLLRINGDALRRALAAKSGEAVDAELEIPDDYDDLPAWVEEHLVGRVVLHPRARQGLKDAVYSEPNLVYQALLMLAVEYRDMRLGLPEAKAKWEEGLRTLQLRVSNSIARERAGEQGDAYFVRYPLHSEQKRFVDLHLRRGTSHDPRYCLALYFFWDGETDQVVVAWLPSHLENRLT